ncbi:hypothetical protein MHBO_002153 [Bonamia ostreae]|uniref:Uncharacterized protein n=1 Tax=Bonamia ostreae TaxID=126728 RepID=A0ABV2AM18_9EUKA
MALLLIFFFSIINTDIAGLKREFEDRCDSKKYRDDIGLDISDECKTQGASFTGMCIVIARSGYLIAEGISTQTLHSQLTVQCQMGVPDKTNVRSVKGCPNPFFGNDKVIDMRQTCFSSSERRFVYNQCNYQIKSSVKDLKFYFQSKFTTDTITYCYRGLIQPHAIVVNPAKIRGCFNETRIQNGVVISGCRSNVLDGICQYKCNLFYTNRVGKRNGVSFCTDNVVSNPPRCNLLTKAIAGILIGGSFVGFGIGFGVTVLCRNCKGRC